MAKIDAFLRIVQEYGAVSGDKVRLGRIRRSRSITSRTKGMQLLDQELHNLINQKIISVGEAMPYAEDPTQLQVTAKRKAESTVS